ncbi:MAG: hypothetical protein NUW37_08875 [Planctomycetes bacterium]|nr:hypothetical protein [Planctomycetota bacterium]
MRKRTWKLFVALGILLAGISVLPASKTIYPEYESAGFYRADVVISEGTFGVRFRWPEEVYLVEHRCMVVLEVAGREFKDDQDLQFRELSAGKFLDLGTVVGDGNSDEIGAHVSYIGLDGFRRPWVKRSSEMLVSSPRIELHRMYFGISPLIYFFAGFGSIVCATYFFYRSREKSSVPAPQTESGEALERVTTRGESTIAFFAVAAFSMAAIYYFLEPYAGVH